MWIDETQLSKQQRRKIEYITKDVTVTKDFENAVDREVYNRDIFREKTKGKTMPRIKVKLLNENCEPARTHMRDAGWDLKATQRVVVPEGQVTKVHTGVIIEIPPRHCGMVVPRSGLGTKSRVTLANDIGIIDSDYRGEIMVFLANDGTNEVVIEQFERFAQLLIVPINQSSLWVVDKLSETARGTGGFGSTTASLVEEVNENPDSKMVFKVKDEPLTMEEEANIPKSDLTQQAEDIAKRVDNKALLSNVPLVEYVKMKSNGTLKEMYPDATGDMKVDLCQ